MIAAFFRFLNIWKSATMTEYCELYIYPQTDRMFRLGLTEAEVTQLYDRALLIANPFIIGQAPGSILHDFADRVESGQTVAQILDATKPRVPEAT